MKEPTKPKVNKPPPAEPKPKPPQKPNTDGDELFGDIDDILVQQYNPEPA